MLNGKDQLIKGSRWAVRIAIWTNRSFLAAVLLGLLVSMIFRAQFFAILIRQHPGVNGLAEMTGLRWLMLLGIAMAAATEPLLDALAQIVASTAAGNPFIATNAQRLRRIGWALLVLQLLDLPGALLQRFFPSLGSAAPNVTFSPGGWIAILMVFVLSRVFTVGSALKDDLEGTV